MTTFNLENPHPFITTNPVQSQKKLYVHEISNDSTNIQNKIASFYHVRVDPSNYVNYDTDTETSINENLNKSKIIGIGERHYQNQDLELEFVKSIYETGDLILYETGLTKLGGKKIDQFRKLNMDVEPWDITQELVKQGKPEELEKRRGDLKASLAFQENLLTQCEGTAAVTAIQGIIEELKSEIKNLDALICHNQLRTEYDSCLKKMCQLRQEK